MSEHIKTGAEIWGEIKDINKKPATTIKELSEQCFDKRILKKWVSLDWLKEWINNRMNSSQESDIDLASLESLLLEMESKVINHGKN